jgi:predicted TIM-barrel fold metal-dependent hydrolase
MSSRSKQLIIDVGVFLGHDPKSSLSASVDNILAIMDRNNIHMAVAASFRAIYGSQAEGNDEVLAIAKKHSDRIIPMAVVSPLSFIPGKGSIEALAKQRFKIIGAFPFYQSWPVDARVLRKMAEEILQAKLLLQIAISNWQDLVGVSKSLGGMKLPVLIRWVKGGGYLYLTEEIALAKDYKNIYFDVGSLTTTGGINTLCSEIGAHRLYICSNMPLVYERSVYYRVYSERLSREDRAEISGGTLAKLLKI